MFVPAIPPYIGGKLTRTRVSDVIFESFVKVLSEEISWAYNVKV